MKTMLLGADPEILVIRNGKISHCIGLLGGTKEAPRPVTGGAVQEDNVAFEFNINPAATQDAFRNGIKGVMSEGLALLGSGFQFSNQASHIFSPEELADMPAAAMVFGCDPDLNALTGETNASPCSANRGLRSAGGHVHFGFAEPSLINLDNQRIMGVMCDYFLGLPSLMLDTDTRRRELYGKAGAIRCKPYGMEYRTLSNFWIHNDDNINWAYDQSKKAHDNLEAFRNYTAQFSPQEVQRVINMNDVRMAEQMVKAMGIC